MQSEDVEERIARAKELRQAMGAFATGVTIVTTLGKDGRRYGLTANSFSSVSLEPPMVSWNQAVQAPSHSVFLESPVFAVNVLAEGQAELSNRFARWGEDKFAGLETSEGIGGAPILAGCAATFECTTVHRYPGGDHVIFVGRVDRFRRAMEAPLIFAGGKYMTGLPLYLPEAIADPSDVDMSDVHAVRLATSEAVALAHRIGETVGVATWGNHGPTMLRWEPGAHAVSPALRTGLVLPVLTSASGLLFSAWLPQQETQRMMEAEAAADPVARVTLDYIAQLLSEIRAKGFASVRSSAFPDMYGGDMDAVSAPVRNARGEVILGLTAIKRSDDPRPDWIDHIAAALKEAAARTSRQLGYLEPLAV